MARIAVLGAGGVGGLLAAALSRSNEEVIVVARESTAELVASHGLVVDSVALGEFAARPRAVSMLEESVDFTIVATKATGLRAALERIESNPGLVVPMLNGIEHLDVLSSRFGPGRVIASVIRVESDRPVSGRIVQTSPTVRVDLASEHVELAGRVQEVQSLLESAGVDTRIGTSERQVMWSKLARLNALALTTSASDQPIGYVRSDPRWRSALEGSVSETVAIANADGARLDSDQTLAELDSAHATLGSSMQRDIAGGREPELDAIAGAVIRAGGRHGLRCPTVEWLARRVAERAGLDWGLARAGA